MRVKLKPLDQQAIVVTGASSGIGLTIAEMAAERGASLMLVARDEESLRAVRDRIQARGGRAEYAVADVADAEDMQRVLAAAIDCFGGVDTWVNNAGVGVYADLLEISREDHERIFQTNYWGLVNGTQVAGRYLMQHGGAIINIGSVLSDVATTPLGAYAASKHAVKGYTDAFRMEMIQRRAPVSVTLIKPSGINSPWADHARNYMDERARVPPMVYAPESVARAVLFAAAHPRRDITVGSSGVLVTALARVAPRLADRLYAAVLPSLHRDSSRKALQTDGLHQPADGGRRTSDHRMVRKHSGWALMSRHPLLTVGLGLLATAAVFGALETRRRRRKPASVGDKLAALPLIASAAAGLGALRQSTGKRLDRTRSAVASGWRSQSRALRRGTRHAMDSVGLH